MRIGLFVAVGLAILLLGGTCIPLVDNITREQPVGKTLAVALTLPAEAFTVRQGETVRVEWTGANLTGEPATIAIIVNSRKDLSSTTVASGLPFDGTGDRDNYDWDTSEAAGPYTITVRLETPHQTHEDTGTELITVDAPPLFEFRDFLSTALDPNDPNGPAVFDPGDTLVIRWLAEDDGGTARIGLDGDEAAHTTGEEIFLAEPNLPLTHGPDALNWTGNDISGRPVEANIYYLFAIVSDGVNPDFTVNAPRQIRIVEAETTEDLVVEKPADDTDALDGSISIPIEYRINRSDTLLVDTKLDTDENHSSGNEITIDARRVVEGGEESDSVEFNWEGQDSAGNDVDDGIYFVFIAVSGDSGPVERVEAEGRILRRPDDTTPLIGILQPTTTTTVDYGDELRIEWQDEIVEDVATTIRLVIDDDPTPNQGEDNPPDDLPEQEIPGASDIDAAGDGVEDTFRWTVPGPQAQGDLELPPGTYYIFAYIEDDGGAGNVSVASGTLIVRDPTQ